MSHTATLICNEITDERIRQRTKEGWTPEHDDEHGDGAMAGAAAAYALCAQEQAKGWDGPFAMPQCWAWDREWFKPKDQRRNLIRAAALIVAEIERLDRAAR
jgi:hypothetical protein